MARKATHATTKRPPPRHQLTLDEALSRLALKGVTRRRMFGGLCYYAGGNPFCFLLAGDLALKLPAAQLAQACARRAGTIFRPGAGKIAMREYLALGAETLADEEATDTLILASYRFVSGQESPEDTLAQSDLLEDRSGLYAGKRGGARGKSA